MDDVGLDDDDEEEDDCDGGDELERHDVDGCCCGEAGGVVDAVADVFSAAVDVVAVVLLVAGSDFIRQSSTRWSQRLGGDPRSG